MGKKIAEVRYSWYHTFCYTRSITNCLNETTHIQQKATDKTLSIAYCTQICTRNETIYEREIELQSCIATFPDEIQKRYLYAILCTMFHRNGLYRVQFLFRLIRQVEIHTTSPYFGE